MVPTSVGSGRGNIFAKVHCLVHAFRLSCKSWKQSAALLRSVVSFTGDLGTESRLPRVQVDLTRFFGAWVEDSDRQGMDSRTKAEDSYADFDFTSDRTVDDLAGDAVAGVVSPADGTDFQVSFNGVLYIPGVLHVLHNATKDLQHMLTHWPWFCERLANVARLVGRPWSRARLLKTCFSTAPHSYQVHLYEHTHHLVYEERWADTSKVAHNNKQTQQTHTTHIENNKITNAQT